MGRKALVGLTMSWRPALAALAVLFLASSVAQAVESVASTIRRMTGARTKIVWVRTLFPNRGHPFGPMNGVGRAARGKRPLTNQVPRSSSNSIQITRKVRLLRRSCSATGSVASWWAFRPAAARSRTPSSTRTSPQPEMVLEDVKSSVPS